MGVKTASLPVAGAETGLKVLRELVSQRSLLVALEIMHAHVGEIFQITMPTFRPAFLVGPEPNRTVLVTQRDKLLWRTESDPVTRLLRHGLLVEDGESHDRLRRMMEPSLHRGPVTEHIEAMVRFTDAITQEWSGGSADMLVEMRKIALLILMGTLFDVPFLPDLERMWQPILRSLAYISPGLWLTWPNVPRPGFKAPLQALDAYLFDLVRARRATVDSGCSLGQSTDLLTHMTQSACLDDGLIRDQLLTMLIAGHDTSTAMLAWALFLLGRHPRALAQAQKEVDTVLGDQPPQAEHLPDLHYLDRVIKETLRLYPPIHVGSRLAAEEIAVGGYQIPEGTRVMYSIYLSHRSSRYWSSPDRFQPERFDRRGSRHRPPPFAYVPFGGGPRNCIGAAFAQVEAKVVLSRILQQFELRLESREVRPHMGATLEPRPGVFMRVRRRRQNDG